MARNKSLIDGFHGNDKTLRAEGKPWRDRFSGMLHHQMNFQGKRHLERGPSFEVIPCLVECKNAVGYIDVEKILFFDEFFRDRHFFFNVSAARAI